MNLTAAAAGQARRWAYGAALVGPSRDVDANRCRDAAMTSVATAINMYARRTLFQVMVF
jgi:hypothetical protein